ncbi:hypothetical protein [Georgenia sp. SUBG003]|uniref:hypothetical protein n=1 Tax=Georgenia sp. SUBG003 TaxID=1497974 RepID=UPI003AB6DAF7
MSNTTTRCGSAGTSVLPWACSTVTVPAVSGSSAPPPALDDEQAARALARARVPAATTARRRVLLTFSPEEG